MKAMVYEGGSDLSSIYEKDIKKPKPNSKQVLIEVDSSSLNIIDFERFKHQDRPSFFAKLINLIQRTNSVLGGEISGKIVKVGLDVKEFHIGDEVFGSTTGIMQSGGWAEYCICDIENIRLKPNNISNDEAAVLPLSGLTALGAIETANISEKESVLIYGASGGVGLYALQIAKAYGATVTAVCSSRNTDLVKKFGADKVIDYKKNNFDLLAGKYNKIISINGFQPYRIIKKHLKKDGIYVIIGNVKQIIHMVFKNIFSKKIIIYSSAITHKKDGLDTLVKLVSLNKLSPYIDKKYSINDVDEAINYVINHHTKGKVAIKMNFKKDKG